MVEIYDSHEQSERVKGWLRENGGAIVMGLALAFGSLFGFKQWQLWEQGKDQQASAEYELMVELLGENNMDIAVGNYETLKKEFPSSAYTALASLHMAKARIESDQPDLAGPMLEYAMNNAQPQPVQVIARERLARLKLDQGEPEAALRLLDESPTTTGFESRFAEIRGDIYKSMGENQKAVQYYTEALELLETGVGYRPLLEMKLEALGGQATIPAGETS